MRVAKTIWDKVRLIGKLPIVYKLYVILTNSILPNGRVVTLRFGPAAGSRWRHYHYYQFWMAMGLYEPAVANFLTRSLAKGSVFYDIGANAGYYTIMTAKFVGNTGKVIAFDPLPINVSTIREQIALNSLDDICIVESLAISDTNGSVQFAVPQRNANAHLAEVEAPHIRNHNTYDLIEVQSIVLDDYVKNHPWPSLIKMDIEGAEVRALQGAQNLLHSPNAPVWVVTAHSSMLSEEVQKIFQQTGYDVRPLHDSTLVAIPPQLKE